VGLLMLVRGVKKKEKMEKKTRFSMRRGSNAGGLMSWLLIFAVAAGFAIAFGLLFGVFNKITTDLNQTGIQIDKSFTSSISTASSFASTGILIVLAIGVIGLAMVLIRVIGGMGGE